MKFELDQYNRNAPDDELIADLQRLASVLGKKSVTRLEQDKHGRFSTNTFIRRFGSWAKACEKAGLEMRQTLPNTPEEELFKNLAEIWIVLGRQPLYSEVAKPTSKFSVATYEKRFGGWRNALTAFVKYINEERASSPELSVKNPAIRDEATPRNSRHINRNLLMQILMRDEFTCRLCGSSKRTDGTFDWHIDHIKPRIKGGLTVLENLQVLCSRCNLLKGDLELPGASTKEVKNVEA